ncbi:serine hydroxymethyltransferase, mitochondrial [Tanacetum coccineum]
MAVKLQEKGESRDQFGISFGLKEVAKSIKQDFDIIDILVHSFAEVVKMPSELTLLTALVAVELSIRAKIEAQGMRYHMFVATGVIPSPSDYINVVTITTHKSLRGPRGAMFIYRKGLIEVNKQGKEGYLCSILHGADATRFEDTRLSSSRGFWIEEEAAVITNGLQEVAKSIKQDFSIIDILVHSLAEVVRMPSELTLLTALVAVELSLRAEIKAHDMRYHMFVATSVIPSPSNYIDVVTTTTHKSLRRPRGAMIIYRKGLIEVNKQGKEVFYDFEDKINEAVFPGL